MSDLPEYTQESAPLLATKGRNQEQRDRASPLAQREGPRHNVLYIFEPRYPVVGKQEQVVGPLGRDEQESIETVQRAFPALASYPSERIQFEVSSIPAYTAPTAANGTSSGQLPTSYPPHAAVWSRLMDDAWAQFDAAPPGRLRVTVKETAADTKLRRRHEVGQVLKIVAMAVSPVLVFMLFVGYMVATDDSTE